MRAWPVATWIVVLSTLAGAVLRFSTLSLQSFWLDESITANLLRRGFFDMLGELPDSESTPPIYYALAWLWTEVFGTSDAAIRSLSALVGTLVIPVVYGAAKELISTRAGVIAAVLTAVHPYLIWYSQEARAYSLLVLFSALAFLYFARALRDGSGRSLVLWAVWSCLALATHYFSGFLVVPEALVLLALVRGRSTVLALGGVLAWSLALTPLLVAQRSTGNAAWISDEPARERIEMLVTYFTVGRAGAVADWLQAAAIGLTIVAAVLLAREWRRRGARRGEVVALGVAGGALALPAVFALVGLDYFWHQNLIAALVPLTVLVAAGLAETRPQWPGLAAASALCVLLAGVTLATGLHRSYLHRDDFERAAAEVGTADRPRAVIVIPEWCDEILQRYLPGLRPMPAAGARVREIDVVATTENHGCAKSRVPTDAPPPVAGFERAGADRVQNLIVLRFRSDRARLAEPEALESLYRSRWPGSVLLEVPTPTVSKLWHPAVVLVGAH
jgi:4-amino-4-deoxy-L-arabinose transferase-like glycosyltransferase